MYWEYFLYNANRMLFLKKVVHLYRDSAQIQKWPYFCGDRRLIKGMIRKKMSKVKKITKCMHENLGPTTFPFSKYKGYRPFHPFYNNVFKLVLFILCFSGLGFSQIPFATESSANPRDAGLFSNPAFLGFEQGDGLFLTSTLPESPAQLVQAGLYSGALGYGFRWKNADPYPANNIAGYDTSYHVFTTGTPLLQRTYWGLRATYWKSGANSNWEYDLGWLAFPTSFLSLGYYTTHLWESSIKMPLEHHLGTAIALPGPGNLKIGYEGVLRSNGYTKSPTLLRDELFASLGTGAITLGVHWQPDFPRSILGAPRFEIAWNTSPHTQSAFSFGTNVSAKDPSKPPMQFAMSVKDFYAAQHNYPHKTIYLDLGGQISEVPPKKSILFLDQSSAGLRETLLQLTLIAADTQIRTVIIDLDGYKSTLAISSEIRRAIKAIRASGKRVIAYSEMLQNNAYYVASACDKIIVQPSGWVNINGLATQVPLFGGLLSKLNIQAQFIRHGSYKSAIEPFTADSMSAENLENTKWLLTSQWNTIRDSMAADRKFTTDSLEQIITMGKIDVQSAQVSGLIDTALYLEDITEWLNTLSFQSWEWKTAGLYSTNWAPRSDVALIYANGPIVSGFGESSSPFGAEMIGDRAFRSLVFSLLENPSLKAIIIRVDSPGGAAIASDNLCHVIEAIKEAGIPVVVSVGGMAASGGYYLAAPADLIFVEPVSIVGSIGIFGGKLNIGEALQKVGVTVQTVRTHSQADAESITRNFTAAESLAIQKYMDTFYARFIGTVAKYRSLDSAGAANVGEGRVFTGEQAIANGLADELGGVQEAIQAAAKLAGIPSSHRLQVQEYALANDFKSLPAEWIQQMQVWQQSNPMHVWKQQLRYFQEDTWALWPAVIMPGLLPQALEGSSQNRH
jgi:signal peptide peptidase SppA